MKGKVEEQLPQIREVRNEVQRKRKYVEQEVNEEKSESDFVPVLQSGVSDRVMR